MGEIDDQEADDSLEAGGDQPDEGVEEIGIINDKEADDSLEAVDDQPDEGVEEIGIINDKEADYSWGAAGDEPEVEGTEDVVDNPGWKVGDQAIARYRKSSNSCNSNKCTPPPRLRHAIYCKS